MDDTATAGSHRLVDGLYPAPYSLQPLTPTLRRGLIAPAVFGLLSVLSATALLIFIVTRFFSWRQHYKSFIGYNQYVVLIMNLLLADLQQGMSFLISFHWIDVDGILAPTRACFAQGWLINIGDISSGLFVFFIATHTFICAVKGQRISHTTFAVLVILTWVLALLLTALGPLMYREKYFVRAGAWCWASSDYERERLALHYIWVFIVQFGTVIIYALVLLHLKKTMSIILPTAAQTATYKKIDRAAKLMILYPLVYIILTLPLSAGRMWSMAHGGAGLPDAYSCIAGALIASTGFVDALLYTLTRKQLLKHSTPHGSPAMPSGEAKRDNTTGWFKGSGSGNKSLNGKSRGSINPSQAWNQLVDGGITQTRTVTVVGRPASANTREDESHNDLAPIYEMSDRLPIMGVSRNRSRSGSADPIMPPTFAQSGHGQGYDGNKKTKTEVSVQVKHVAGSDRSGSLESPVTLNDEAMEDLASDEEGGQMELGSLKTEKGMKKFFH